MALAPSLPMPLLLKTIFVIVLLTFNASARAWGQKRWQTTWNLVTYQAICDTYRKPCPPPKIWSQDRESKSRWISTKLLVHIAYLYWIFSLALQVTEHPPPSHLSSCFHPISMALFCERSNGPTPEYPSNNTKVSQVSNTTGTPLDSILKNPFHRFEARSHRTPRQAPGLGSFLAKCVVPQVDVRNCLVGFQCFCKGLGAKTMANHVKSENLQGDLRHWQKAMSTTKNLKPRSRVKVKVTFHQNKILLDTRIEFFL